MLNIKFDSIRKLEISLQLDNPIDSDLSTVDEMQWDAAAKAREARSRFVPFVPVDRKIIFAAGRQAISIVSEWFKVSFWENTIVATTDQSIKFKVGTGARADIFTIVWNRCGKRIRMEYHYPKQVAFEYVPICQGVALEWTNVPSVLINEFKPGAPKRKKEESRAVKAVESIKLWIPKQLISTAFVAEVEKGRFKEKNNTDGWKNWLPAWKAQKPAEAE